MEKMLSILNKINENELNMSNFRKNLSSIDFDNLIKLTILENLEQLYAVDYSDEKIITDLKCVIEPTIIWSFEAYSRGVLSNINQNYNSFNNSNLTSQYMSSINGVEETIWCPTLGIKGQIDMISKCKIAFINNNKPSSKKIDAIEDMLLPIELKTGKWSPTKSLAHRAQV